MSDLQVEFGATTTEVEAGAARVKAAIEGLSEVASAIDGNSVANLLKGNRGVIGQIVERYTKDNPSAFGRMARA